jgi:glycosyltransferase involved in cell wall biosynthesis
MSQSERTPTVSWVLCSHVANEQLKHAVQSCLDQTFTDFELLLVANGKSATEVAEAANAWFGHDERLRVLTTEVRQLPFSLSLGLYHARASLVARMDSDDLAKPDRLDRQVNFMRTHPRVAVLGSCYEVIDATGRVKSTVHVPLEDASIRRALHTRNPMCHPSVMFRRSVVLHAGGYVGGLQAEDYDLWIRLAADPTVKFANLSEVCLSYREVGVGHARAARAAYASVAGAQLRAFFGGRQPTLACRIADYDHQTGDQIASPICRY